MIRRLPHAVWLVIVWVALWGDVTVANVAAGAVVAGLVLWVFGRATPHPATRVRPIDGVRYAGLFTRLLIQANIAVAVQVLRPVADLRPGILAAKLPTLPDAIVTLIANSITLTPGTLTMDVRRRGGETILYVHCLDLRDPEGVRRDIADLEYFAVGAFGTSRARAARPVRRRAEPVRRLPP